MHFIYGGCRTRPWPSLLTAARYTRAGDPSRRPCVHAVRGGATWVERELPWPGSGSSTGHWSWVVEGRSDDRGPGPLAGVRVAPPSPSPAPPHGCKAKAERDGPAFPAGRVRHGCQSSGGLPTCEVPREVVTARHGALALSFTAGCPVPGTAPQS